MHNARSSKQTITLLRQETSEERTNQIKTECFYMAPKSAVELGAAMSSEWGGENSGGKTMRAINHTPMVMLLC